MSKETALSSSTEDDILQGISSISISDNSDICGNIRSDNATTELCANCGKEGGNLKLCAACKLVKYCSRDCQFAHRPQHKKECRRRVAELHDEKLFKQPPPRDDCPICFLRLPWLGDGRQYKSCCGKIICSGCIHAVTRLRETDIPLCPFCRIPSATSDEENVKRMMKRVDAGDAEAMSLLGEFYSDAACGLRQDHAKAFELYHRAAELGHTPAYSNIGRAYNIGEGVEIDEKKANHYFELAAMRGSAAARHSLGVLEKNGGNIGRAIKHYVIAVGGGDNLSMKQIQQLFMLGYVSKDEYTEALRAYQKYLAEVKSSQRDEAAAAYDRYRYL